MSKKDEFDEEFQEWIETRVDLVRQYAELMKEAKTVQAYGLALLSATIFQAEVDIASTMASDEPDDKKVFEKILKISAAATDKVIRFERMATEAAGMRPS